MAGEFLLHNHLATWSLPVPDHGGLKVTQRRIGGAQVSINGSTTLHTFGFRKEWEFTWTGLTEDEFAILDMLHQRDVPLTMYDPTHRNMFRAEAAASLRDRYLGGLYPATPGTVTFGESNVTGYPTKFTKFVPTTPGINNALASNSFSEYWVHCPPPGQEITMSVWVYQASGTPGFIQAEFRNGDTDSWYTAVVGGSWTTGSWQRVSMTTTVPSNSVGVVLDLVTGIGSTEIQTTGWQMELGSTATPWVPGHGTPKVHMTELDPSVPRLGLIGASAKFVEA